MLRLVFMDSTEDCKVKDLWESETCNQHKHLNKVVHVQLSLITKADYSSYICCFSAVFGGQKHLEKLQSWGFPPPQKKSPKKVCLK